MRILFFSIIIILACTGCDHSRLYEKNADFKQRYWVVSEKPAFDFDIQDTEIMYNLYITLRNESDYPHSNIYFTYYLNDSTGRELEKKLASEFLFDKKTGQPFGSSGLGYIYEHKFPLFESYKFPQPGQYSIRYEQFMRTDTLHGIVSVGLRVEKADKKLK
jgi:gliding motility-associated lipoprotein GldH